MNHFDRFPLVPTLLVLANEQDKHKDDPALYPAPDEVPVLCRIDLKSVESFRKILDSKNEVVDNEVYVKMKSGDYHHLEMSFNEFDQLYLIYVDSIS